MDSNGKSKINILLVDDQPGKLLTYEAILGELNENLVTAGSAREALQHLLKGEFAVVLVDVCMPEMDGFELVQVIRKHPRCRKTAIILVSAVYMSDFDRLRGYDCGAVDYLPVPIIPEVLRAKVGVFADLYRKNEALARMNDELEQRVAERTAALEASTASLRENEERLRIALETGGLGAWELDLEGGDLNCTDLFRTHHGLSDDGVMNYAKLMKVIHHEDRDRVEDAFQHAVRTKSDFDAEFRCVWPDGSTHWIISKGRPVVANPGCPSRMLGVSLDITARKRAEEERSMLLESERAARMEAECAGRAKDEFLAMLSHEMRTPLNAITGWVQLLRRNTEDAASLARGLETIERNARAQSRLIEDLFDISRVVSGKFQLDLDMVDLPPILGAAIEAVRPAAEAKAIEIIRDFDLRVRPVVADAGRLEQVMFNLLSNAIKFTPSRGSVWVTLSAADPYIEINVSDTGEGIDPQFLPYVFDRFRQADSSRTRRYGGMGLGLSIARHLVELHGGTISANNGGKSKGGSFTIRLKPVEPNWELSHVAGLAVQLNPQCLKGVRILVIDDDEGACELMKYMLNEYHAIVEVELSPQSVLARFDANPPFDLLISDIGMPGTDGYELMREIRSRTTAARDIPAIALTGYARPEDREHALCAGYDRHISKPVNPSDLVTLILEVLQEARERLGAAPRR